MDTSISKNTNLINLKNSEKTLFNKKIRIVISNYKKEQVCRRLYKNSKKQKKKNYKKKIRMIIRKRKKRKKEEERKVP